MTKGLNKLCTPLFTSYFLTVSACSLVISRQCTVKGGLSELKNWLVPGNNTDESRETEQSGIEKHKTKGNTLDWSDLNGCHREITCLDIVFGKLHNFPNWSSDRTKTVCFWWWQGKNCSGDSSSFSLTKLSGSNSLLQAFSQYTVQYIVNIKILISRIYFSYFFPTQTSVKASVNERKKERQEQQHMQRGGDIQWQPAQADSSQSRQQDGAWPSASSC